MSPQMFLIAMLVLVPMCSGYIGGSQSSVQDLSPRVYCGRNLARVIAHLCFKVPVENAKRSDTGTMYGALIAPYYKEQDHVGWPWLPSSKAMALGSGRDKRLISGGIADECCEKPCTMEELLYYC